MRDWDRARFEQFAGYVRRDAEVLLGRVDVELERLERAAGTAPESAVRWSVEQNLAEIERQLTRAQLLLVHPADHRYAAACSLLRTLDAERRPGPASDALGRAADRAAAVEKAA